MKSSSTERLGTESMGKLLVSMCSQTTLALLVYSIYSITDTFFIARGVSTFAAGGVAIVTPLLIVLGAISTTVGSGAASVISRALGREDKEEAGLAAANSFLIFWAAAILITIIGLLLLEPMLYMLGVTPSLMGYARGYARIILLGAITSTGFSSLIRAEGNIKYSTAMWVLPILVNLILAPVFLYIFHMGVEGVALATVLAQSASACMSIYYFFFSRRDAYKILPRHFKLKLSVIKEIVAIGCPSLIQQLGASIVVIFINRILKDYGGDIAISTYGIASRISAFFLMPVTGIIQGLQPILGYNYGKRLLHRVKQSLKITAVTVVLYGSVVLLLCSLLSRQLLLIFTDEKEVLALGTTVLTFITLSYPIKGLSSVISAYFQAVGKAGLSLILSLSCNILVYIPTVMILSKLFGLTGLWISFLLSDLMALVLSGALIFRSERTFLFRSNSAG